MKEETMTMQEAMPAKKKTNGVQHKEVVFLPSAEVDGPLSNYRKTFEGIEELSTSLVNDGQIQPCVVRKKGLRHELVIGERRWRAAKLASLPLMCLVVDWDDATVLERQLVENVARQDVPPLEEAEGFEKLMKIHGRTADQIALMTGKHRASIFNRLKLLSLCPEARKELREGRLDVSIAYVCARINSSDRQKQFLRELNLEHEFSKPTARRALELLRDRFMLRLVDASFDKKDKNLVAGATDCASCPKRTGNQPDLFGELKSTDLCTDPDCFDKKSNAAWDKQCAEAKKRGSAILSEKEAKQIFYSAGSPPSGGYVALDSKCFDDKQGRTFRQLLKEGPQGGGTIDFIVLARNPHDQTTHEIVRSKDVDKRLRENGHKFAQPKPATKPSKRSTPTPSGSRSPEQQAKDSLEKKIEARAVQSIIAAVTVAALKRKPDASFWRFLIELAGAYPEETLRARGLKGKLETELAKMKEDELRAFFIEDRLRDSCFRGSLEDFEWAEPKKLVRFFGVDVKRFTKLAKDAVEDEAKSDVPARDAKAQKRAEATLKRGGKKTTVKKGSKR